MELILVLDNIRSTYNVGAILRTAEGLGVAQVMLSGVTPAFCGKSAGRAQDSADSARESTYGGKSGQLPHVTEKLRRAVHKTALGAEEMVSCEYVENILEKLQELKNAGWKVVGLENNLPDGYVTLKLGKGEWRELFGKKVVLVLGEEVNGINDKLYDAIEVFLEIPMRGRKESLNVSVAAGVAVFELMK